MGDETTPTNDELAEELEGLGLSGRALAAAILRAKVKTRVRRAEAARSEPPEKRPKLATDPELDAWFDR